MVHHVTELRFQVRYQLPKKHPVNLTHDALGERRIKFESRTAPQNWSNLSWSTLLNDLYIDFHQNDGE